MGQASKDIRNPKETAMKLRWCYRWEWWNVSECKKCPRDPTITSREVNENFQLVLIFFTSTKSVSFTATITWACFLLEISVIKNVNIVSEHKIIVFNLIRTFPFGRVKVPHVISQRFLFRWIKVKVTTEWASRTRECWLCVRLAVVEQLCFVESLTSVEATLLPTWNISALLRENVLMNAKMTKIYF